MSVRRLLLARHGQTGHNSERRFTGWADPPLNRHGRAEARALGRRLKDQTIQAAYCSDLQRTIETARIALDGHHDVEPIRDSALREANFGAWQGLTWDEAQTHDPAAFELLLKRSGEFCAPGGETMPALYERVTRFFQGLHERHDGETVLIVASGGPLQVMIAAMFSMPLASHWRLGMNNCSLSIVDFVREEAILTALNERTHLNRLRRASARARMRHA